MQNLGFLLFLTRASESHHLVEKINSKKKKNSKLKTVIRVAGFELQCANI